MPEDSPERQRPLWDATTLKIAGAIARGEASVDIDYLPDGATWLDLLHAYQGCGVNIVPADSACGAVREELAKGQRTFAKVEQFFQRQQAWHEQEAEKGRQRGLGNQTLHQALDAYEQHLARTMLLPDGSGRISATGRLWQRQVRQIKAHAEDMPLGLFNLDKINRMISHWASRPTLKRTGKPASPDTVKDIIKRVRTFIKWLHKSTEFRWRRPEDYEPGRVRIRLTPAEMSARLTPDKVQTYTLEELGTLYEYASLWERFLMVLALNCGFGIDQISMLQVSEVHAADERHPSPWIGRVRYKTGVYGEWTLMPQAVQAIEWMKKRRGDSKETALVLTKKGKPLSLTAGSNRNMAVPNAWAILTARVQKDHPGFRKLSFNKLRKTALDLVRRLSDGETAGVFACHGQVVSDDLLERYANRHFAKVFHAIDQLHKLLAPVFAKVADPFPADMKKHNPSVTLAQRKRMAVLRAQGYTQKKIAEELGLNRATVAAYLKNKNY